MKLHRSNLRKTAVMLAATAVIGGAAPAALAADVTDVTVTGGTLGMSAYTVGNFAGVTLNGTTQTTKATVDPFSVDDARGTGAGWNLTIQATQFKEVDAAGLYIVAGKTLPLNSMNSAALTVTAATGTTSTAPTTTAATGVDNTTGAIKIASAAVDTGMGKYNFTGTDALSLSVGGSAYAKTYRSEATLTLASTP